MRLHICWGNYEGRTTTTSRSREFWPCSRRGRRRSCSRPPIRATSTSGRSGATPDPGRQGAGAGTDRHLLELCRARRADRAASRALRRDRRRDRVVASTDCGFGTFAGYGKIDPAVAWKKSSTVSSRPLNVEKIIREETMARIDRRKFLQSSGGGLAGILASGRAPAFAQGTTLHWLRLGDFVPASDTLLRRELLPEAEKALGIKINARDHQRQRPAGAHHLGDPVRHRRRHHPCDATTGRSSMPRAWST